MLSWIGIGLLIVVGLVLVLVDNPGEAVGLDDSDLARLVAGVALLIVIGGSMLVGNLGRASEMAKQAVTWLGILLLLVAGYSYRNEFMQLGNRMLGELSPGTPTVVESGGDDGSASVVAIQADVNGHFSVSTLVNGTHVEMIADTGASAVVLTSSDAQRAGIDLAALRFTVPVSTANGTTTAASTTLDEVSVGGIAVRNVRALVAQPDVLHRSLLGMTYLQRIGAFEMSGTQLVLRR